MSDLCIRIVFEHLDHPVPQHDRAKWEETIGDRLGGCHHVRLNAPEPRTGPCAGPSVGGNDLIGDEENAIAVADFADHRRK